LSPSFAVALASVFRKLDSGSAGGVLALPNMFPAGAGNGISRLSLGELLFADRARLGHYVGHNLGSLGLGLGHVQLPCTSGAKIRDAFLNSAADLPE